MAATTGSASVNVDGTTSAAAMNIQPDRRSAKADRSSQTTSPIAYSSAPTSMVEPTAYPNHR